MKKERIAEELISIAEELLRVEPLERKGWIGLHTVAKPEDISNDIKKMTRDIRILTTIVQDKGLDYTNAPDLGVAELVEAVRRLETVYYQGR